MQLAQINMLRFGCLPAGDAPLREALHASLDAARAACPDRIAVYEAEDVEAGRALRPVNADPYAPPKPVTAAGGYVVRVGAQGPEVLLIERRGVWDLPKGKLDDGESIEACAVREVQEEVGIASLRVVRPLGATVHGYPEKGVYRVKTTHWFLMTTPERDFTPQAEEDITSVAWVPWAAAGARLGFESLRRHHAAVPAAAVEAAGGTKS